MKGRETDKEEKKKWEEELGRDRLYKGRSCFLCVCCVCASFVLLLLLLLLVVQRDVDGGTQEKNDFQDV